MLGKGGNGQDVVSMTEREKARKLAPLRGVETYWHALCGENTVPLRSEIDPRGMESALEFAFLLERIAPSMAKIRVAGSHLSDLMGMQVAGMPLSTLIAPEDRERFGQAIARLFSDPAIVRIEVSAQDGFGKPAMRGWLILMPLRSDFGEVSRALGALVTEGRIGRTPRRFQVSRITVEPAINGEAKTPDTETATKPLATPAKPFAPKKPTPSDQPKAPLFGESTLREDLKDEPSLLTRLPKRTLTKGAQAPTGKQPRRSHLRLVVSND